MPVAAPVDVVTRLRAEASRLGFSRLGIAPAGPPPRHAAFRDWLARGLAGGMHDWLARHEPLRADPRTLLPGAASIVMLATDHAVVAAAEEPPPQPADVGTGPPPQDAAIADRHTTRRVARSAAWRHATDGVAPGESGGRVARYAWGDDYHDLLRARGNALAAWLEAAVPGCSTRAVVDSAPLAERDFGALAGLGWIGKNAMLIDPRAGSYFLLTALLTDVSLPADAPLDVDHCGTCTACLDACPTAAFPAPGVLDAGRCISALTIEEHGPIAADLRPGMADWIFGCDVCQEVCPWNRRAPGSAEPALQPRDGATALDPAAVLKLDEAAFRDRFRGSAIRRAKRRGLLRSAAIALGNRPDAGRLAVLVGALADDEPVVRGAAAWALGRWRAAGVVADGARQALADRLPLEPDAEVRGEIAAALG